MGFGLHVQLKARQTARPATNRRSLKCRAEAKNIMLDNQARSTMLRGIDKLADAVGVTLGPRGKISFRIYFRVRMPFDNTNSRK
jgi:hypothetical protein